MAKTSQSSSKAVSPLQAYRENSNKLANQQKATAARQSTSRAGSNSTSSAKANQATTEPKKAGSYQSGSTNNYSGRGRESYARQAIEDQKAAQKTAQGKAQESRYSDEANKPEQRRSNNEYQQQKDKTRFLDEATNGREAAEKKAQDKARNDYQLKQKDDARQRAAEATAEADRLEAEKAGKYGYGIVAAPDAETAAGMDRYDTLIEEQRRIAEEALAGINTTDKERDEHVANYLKAYELESSMSGWATDEQTAHNMGMDSVTAEREKWEKAVMEDNRRLGNDAHYGLSEDAVGRQLFEGWASDRAAGSAAAIGTGLEWLGNAVQIEDQETGERRNVGPGILRDAGNVLFEASQAMQGQGQDYWGRGTEDMTESEKQVAEMGKAAADMTMDMIENFIIPGSAPERIASGIPFGRIAMGLRAAGQGALIQADRENNDINTRMAKAAFDGAVAFLSEYAVGGAEAVYGKSILGKALAEKIPAMASPVLKTVLNTEGVEEVLEYGLTYLGDKYLGFDPNAQFSQDEAKQNFFVGYIMGVLFNGVAGGINYDAAKMRAVVDEAAIAYESGKPLPEIQKEAMLQPDENVKTNVGKQNAEPEADTDQTTLDGSEPAETSPASEFVANAETPASAAQPQTQAQADVIDILMHPTGENGKLSNSQVRTITSDPTMLQAFQEITGTAPDTSSASNTRNSIKDAGAQYIADQQKQATGEIKSGELPRMSMEDFANNDSPVWNNIDYNDEKTKIQTQQEAHDRMVNEGKIVVIPESTSEKVSESFPDLRGMKKKERVPILKEKLNTLKKSLRSFLTGLKNKGSFEFEVNGNILEAKLYDTGIKEVLQDLSKNSASMLYHSADIFKNAEYLYSTPDYDNDSDIYRWNYFYTPVQFGDEVVGVRIAVRDMIQNPESQIYNWGIKQPQSLGGGAAAQTSVHSNASSDSGVLESADSSDTNVPQDQNSVNTEQNNPSGKTDISENTEADNPKPGSGTVSFDGAVVDGRTYQAVDKASLNKKQKAQIAVMEKVAEVTGINVTFYQSQRNENGRYTGANGLYKDGTIYLDVNAGLYAMSDDGKRTVGELAIVRTAAHEMTHFIEQFNETEYNAIRDYMVDQLTKAKGLDGLEDLIDQKMKRDSTGKLTREGAIDEIIADGCEMMLKNSEAIEQMATENPSLAHRIQNWIHDWVAKIKAAFEGVEAVHEEAKVMMRNAEELQKMWDAALKNAAKNVGNENTAREGGANAVQYLERDEKQFNPESTPRKQLLQRILDSAESFERRYLYFGRFTEDFRSYLADNSIEAKDLPILMNFRDAYLSMEKKENGKYHGDNISYHDLGVDGLNDVMDNFTSPNTVMRSKKDGKVELALSLKDNKNRNILVIVELNTSAQHAKKFIEAHIVNSVYGRRNIEKYIETAQKEGRLLPQKQNELSQGMPSVQYRGDINESSSEVSISQETEKSNTKVQNFDQEEVSTTGSDSEFQERDILPESAYEGFESEQNQKYNRAEHPRGAANPNDETDAEFDRLNKQHGSIEKGENPARDINVPKKDSKGLKVGEGARTVFEADATPEERIASLKAAVVNGNFGHIPVSNDTRSQNAASKLAKDGWTKSVADFMAAVDNGRADADTIALGAHLLNEAGNSTECSGKQYIDLVMAYNDAVSDAGSRLAAGRILKTLTPEGKLYGMEKTVERMNKDIRKNNEKRKPGKQKAEIKLDEQLVEDYLNAKTDEERSEIHDKLVKNAADQVPNTFRDKFTALRYLNMLGNFKTQMRNVLGNVGMTTVQKIKNEARGGIEGIVKAASGGKYERQYKGFYGADRLKAASADFASDEDLRALAMGEKKYSDVAKQSESEILDAKKPFSEKNPIGKFLNLYNDLTGKAMEVGDLVFVRANYADALAGYMNAHGITAADWKAMVKDPARSAEVDKARAFAVKQAQEATFRDTNAVSKFASTFDNRWPGMAKKITQGVVPFRKTPANVLVRMEEYSPLGVINTAVKGIQAAKGTAEISDVIDSAAKTATGSALTVLGILLASMGRARTKDDDKDEEAFAKLQGKQDYSIEVGGTSVTMDWLSPASAPFFMGVEAYNLAKEGGFKVSDLFNVAMSITNPMLEMSMLSGVNDALNNLSDFEGDNSAIAQFVLNSAWSYLTQGISNTMLGQMEQYSEKYRQTYYTDKENPLLPTWAQKKVAKLGNKTPGVDYNAADYIDAWGRKQENDANLAERAWNVFLNPGYVSKMDQKATEADAVIQSLLEFGKTQKDRDDFPNVVPRTASRSETVNGKKLTPEEYDVYATTKGQESLNAVTELSKSDVFKGMDKFAQAEAIKDVYEYAEFLAASKVAKARGEEYRDTRFDGLEDVDHPAIVIGAKAGFNDAKNHENWSGLDSLLKAANSGKMSDADREYLEDNVQTFWKYADAAEDGLASKTLNDFDADVKARYTAEHRTAENGGDVLATIAEQYERGKINLDDADALMGREDRRNEGKIHEQLDYELKKVGKGDADVEKIWLMLQQFDNGEIDKSKIVKEATKNVPKKDQARIKNVITSWTKTRARAGFGRTSVYNAMRSASDDYTPADIQKFWEIVDANGDGTLTKKEYNSKKSKIPSEYRGDVTNYLYDAMGWK